jgi:flagellar biogenesis protein FliO
MTGDAVFAIFPILTIIFYIAPVVFVIWFLVKFIKIQQEKNKILRTISDKLDKLNI